MHPLAIYLQDCRDRYKTGAVTPETSLYHPLEVLLNAVGGKLKKPRVHCFMNLKQQGAGLPDGGLFTADQIPRGDDEPLSGQKPARGVIECKKPAEDVVAVADAEQVSRYWEHYNQVLVTNYREFALIGRDDRGNPVRHEYYRLADSEKNFWKLAARPEDAVTQHGDRLPEFLERCLRRPVPLTEPKDVAWFLASYARDALGRVRHARAHQQVETVRKALEDALGLKVTDAKGEHFFQSTLVQTLFYGVFSAWVLWHRDQSSAPSRNDLRKRAVKEGSAAPVSTDRTKALRKYVLNDRFDWEKAPRYLHVPILRKLFRELTDPANLDEWDNLTEVMNWAADTLNRVDRSTFFAKFQDAEAVQYFYEPFLEAFDPELRKQLGVWYTPREIVQYMVARVDQVLKSDFGKPDGLADKDVYVLDPCCGTGAFLVEALAVIEKALRDKGEDALLAGRLKQAATERLFGFEILPAPFVVSHLQLGLFLQQHGAPLVDKKHERAAVYLTNALTGWEPPTGAKQRLLFPEMEEERDAADEVKQGKPILVVIGNPPYNGFAGMPVKGEKEADLVLPYRTTRAAPAPQGQGLNDLYVRFFRVAERCITERHQQHGIVCYISNYSWLDRRSHTGIRERFLSEFDQIWIDNLNGDKRDTGKLTPDGLPDPSVFSTEQNREGIQVGTAIALLARTPQHRGPAVVRHRDFWGESKREELLASAAPFKKGAYTVVEPPIDLALPFRPTTKGADSTHWPTLAELFATTFPGIFTARDQFVVDIDESDLRERVEAYFDLNVSHEAMKEISAQAMQVANRFDPIPTRDYLRKRGISAARIVRFAYRPFDIRWLYWEPETKLLNEKRTEYVENIFAGNLWITATKQNRKDFDPPLVVHRYTTLHMIERGANLFPMLLRPAQHYGLYADKPDASRLVGDNLANLSDAALAYLSTFKGVSDTPHLFHHAIAVLHAPQYAKENGAALRQDWPRIPLPKERAALVTSADLGRKVAALLDPETPVPGVTAGKIPPALKAIGAPSKTDRGQFAGRDFAVTARWGIAGKGGITMPGKGKVVGRLFDEAEKEALGAAATLLGPDTCDIYLNDKAYWKNVPRRVWEYTLGGYQVLKKWLSYREELLLGRPLTLDEVDYLTQVARRIAALLLLGSELDANYAAVKAATYDWQGSKRNPSRADPQPGTGRSHGTMAGYDEGRPSPPAS